MNVRSSRHPSLLTWLTAGTAALVVLLAAFALAGSPSASADCQGSFSINFAGLAHGARIDNQYAAQGVHIAEQANEGFPDALIVFDTNLPPTHDPDLAVDIGNIAILPKNLTDQNHDGLVDDPDENNFGGKVTFTFDQDVSIGSFIFVDHDHQPADFAAAYDASGGLIKKVFIPIGANGSVQTINVNSDGVRRFELVYRDSGGFTGIEVTCSSAATPTPTAAGQGATATPTATPASGTQATPTPKTTAAAATPTPGAQAAAATPASSAPSAVAGVVSGPSAQGFPTTGDGPIEGGLSDTALLMRLAGALAIATGGAFLLLSQRRRVAEKAVPLSGSVRRSDIPQTSGANDLSRASGRPWLLLAALYAALAIGGLLFGRRG